MSASSAKFLVTSLQSQINMMGAGSSAIRPDELKRVLGSMVHAMNALADAIAEVERKAK